MADTLLLAFGLVLIIEGLAPALFPNKWRAYLRKLAEQPITDIRNIGLFVLSLGIIVIWLSQ
ncbi:DUF2065 domain-containing protein [Candidatus Colwellia aromaticivorans]|uniref:DUF2065 domain-containing protein n=1 Tax=Candidatus Colwellia aromaticivorans TaxID=2267621 RepID=UPI000DF272E4|nr:DUF2065 domain-containing protein [Candidatus Colwellia aromaticivorans]